jgi:hypothetical protein
MLFVIRRVSRECGGVRGYRLFKKYVWNPSPGPLARATLSRWERDLSQNV